MATLHLPGSACLCLPDSITFCGFWGGGAVGVGVGGRLGEGTAAVGSVHKKSP